MSEPERADRRRRRRLGRPRHRRLLRRARPRGRRDRHRRGQGRRAEPRRGADPRAAASPSCSSETASASTSRPRSTRCWTSARLLFCCVDTPPTYSGDADLSRVQAVVAELAPSGEHALVMKSTVPAGHRRARSGATLPDLAYVSCPEFLKEGSAVDDFLHPDRVVIGADPGDEWAADAVAGALRAARRRAGPHRRRLRRDDQARLQRLPRDQDLVHQRDRQRLRGGRRRRHRGRPRHGPRRAHRADVPARRASATAGSCFPKDVSRSSSSPATPATTSSCSTR